jgi:hypothetical protein
MMGRLQITLGKSKEELLAIISALWYSSFIIINTNL